MKGINHQVQERILLLGAYVLPVAVAGLAQVRGGSASAAASQSTASSLQVPTAISSTRKIRAECERAYQESLRLHEQEDGKDPFYHTAVQIPVETPATVEPPQVEAPKPAESFHHTLDGMMRKGNEPLVMIDGKLHHIGDDIGNGWVIQSMDFTVHEVVVRGPDGTERTLK